MKYDHRKWRKYVVNFNIALNGNTSKDKATANIQQFFDMTKHYEKNLKFFTDLGDFLGVEWRA